MQNNREPLIKSFVITHVMDCLADPTKNRVVAELSDDVSDVFPYLNAVLSDAMYNPQGPTLTLRRGGRLLTFYPRLVTLAKVGGEEDATKQLEWFRATCNEIWCRRHEVEPLYERRKLLGPLDVYHLLPKLNCHQCGEEACMAFAWGLLSGDHVLPECPHLKEPSYQEAARRLAELLQA